MIPTIFPHEPTDVLTRGRVTKLVVEAVGNELVVRISLLNDEVLGARLIEVSCCGAQQVTMRGENVNSAFGNLTILMATDVSSRGLDALRYWIVDYEEELISLWCRDVTVTPA